MQTLCLLCVVFMLILFKIEAEPLEITVFQNTIKKKVEQPHLEPEIDTTIIGAIKQIKEMEKQ